jgi:hypothetical protein
MFVHPRCPCTQASLTELEKIQARAAQPLDLRIAALLPDGKPAAWARTPLTRRAELLPGAIITIDAGGSEAARFGVRSSGEALLYDPSGRLVYRGGTTAARGHEGDNPGSDTITSLIAGTATNSGANVPATCPAFGCPLFNHQPSLPKAAP